MTKKIVFFSTKYFSGLILFLALLCTITGSSVFGNVFIQSGNKEETTGEDSIGKEDKLFNTHEVLEITIYTDFRTLFRDIGENPQYHPAVVSYLQPGEDSVLLNVNIKTRGHYRKRKENCDFPPLKIKFPEDQSKNTLFEGQGELKLVTHCRTNRKLYNRYLLQEYLVYRTYNFITEFGYKVRLLKVNYVDMGTKFDPFTRYGFFLERTKNMARRNHGIEIETKGISKTVTDCENSSIFFLFQYMIGNTDWSVPVLHNVKMLALPGPSYIPVPYDFDFCGIVGTWYSAPDSILPITSVKQRCWRGPGQTHEELAPTFEIFNDQKNEIYSMLNHFTLLEKKYIENMLSYYDKFYVIINDPRKIKREFRQTCSSRRKTP